MRSGQVCPQCGNGRLRIRTSKRVGQYQKQYAECTNATCGHKCAIVVPESQVFRRR